MALLFRTSIKKFVDSKLKLKIENTIAIWKQELVEIYSKKL